VPIWGGGGSASVLAGAGDELHMFGTGEHGRFVNVTAGSAAAPDTTPGPLAKFERTVALPSTSGNLGELEAALLAYSRGVPGNKIQVTALAAIAELRGDDVGAPNDVGAGYFFGTWDVTAPPLQAANNHGIEGSYHAARNTGSPTILIGTIECQAQQYYPRNQAVLTIASIVGDGTTTTVTVTANPSRVNRNGDVTIAGTGQAGWDGLTFTINAITGAATFTFLSSVVDTKSAGTATVYLGDRFDDRSGGVPYSLAYDCASNGRYRTGAAFVFNRAGGLGGPAFHVGIYVPAFPSVGDGRGPIDFASYYDDGQADVSIYVAKPHAQGAIIVDAGAGAIVAGANSSSALSSAIGSTLIVTEAAGSSAHPLAFFGSALGAHSHYVMLGIAGSAARWYIAGGANTFLTGDAQGDTGMKVSGAYRIGGTGGVALVANASGQLGLFGHAPAAQPNRITLANYTSAPRTFDRASYTMDQLADFVCELHSYLKSFGAHA
jgi:hypothetical protein